MTTESKYIFKNVPKSDGLWCEIYEKESGKMIETYRYLSEDERREEMAKVRLQGKPSEGICPHCHKDFLQPSRDDCFGCTFCEKRCNADKTLKKCFRCHETGYIDLSGKCHWCGWKWQEIKRKPGS